MFHLPPILTDASLMALRLMIGVVFLYSGWSHVKDPAGRAQSIGLSKHLTLLVGIAEIAGSVGVALGVLPQLAALGLILIMLGAIHRKMFVWKTGFLGQRQPGLALRPDLRGNELDGDRDWRRKLGFAAARQQPVTRKKIA